MKDQFKNFILPYLKKRKPKKILEIGVLDGGATIQILKYCEENNCQLVSIDPLAWTGNIPDEIKKPYKDFTSNILGQNLRPTYVEKIFELNLNKNWTCLKINALDFLNSESFDSFDVCLWDGDHNYFSLFNELKLLHLKSKKDDLIFIQGIEKWNRKDQYYSKKLIPLEFQNGKKQGLIRAINDFVKITTNIRYFRLIPFLYLKSKNWKYKKITNKNHGLALLTKL